MCNLLTTIYLFYFGQSKAFIKNFFCSSLLFHISKCYLMDHKTQWRQRSGKYKVSSLLILLLRWSWGWPQNVWGLCYSLIKDRWTLVFIAFSGWLQFWLMLPFKIEHIFMYCVIATNRIVDLVLLWPQWAKCELIFSYTSK